MLCFVCALPAEARPIISAWGLETVDGPALFPLYRSDATWLVVSGIGKTSAAAAVSYLYARSGEIRDAVWLNVGVGGHRDRAPGEVALAHKIADRARGASWFPPIVFSRPCATVDVVTVERPESEFAGDAVYDMEASGFAATASRLSTAELVHSVKVISDNRATGTEPVTAERVEEWIGGAVPALRVMSETLLELSSIERTRRGEPEDLQLFLDRWRYSVTEERRLKRLLERSAAVGLERSVLREALATSTGARDLLARLDRRLCEQSLRFDGEVL